MKYRPIIGLETHVQLNTKTKLFCRCLNEYTPDDPNKNICPFCTGQPGALPLLNKGAVKKAIDFGVAVGATIPEKTRWDRKNYFYPDLPAGYQISQYDNPIVEGGELEFFVEDKETGDFSSFKVELTRAHLEADAAKLLHAGGKTMVDFNRSAAPLIEIVTEPCIHSSLQAQSYVNELQLLVRRLGISDGDMEKGQMRFDVNVSLQNEDEQKTDKLPEYRVEVKNVNSIRAMGRAIEFEIARQTKMLEKGELPDQETRGWKDDEGISVVQRSKEDAMDYRYFPEPDLQILVVDHKKDVPNLADLPELPSKQRQRYIDLGLSLQSANTFVNQEEVGGVFDEVMKEVQVSGIADNKKVLKVAANILSVNLLGVSAKEEKPVSKLMFPRNILALAKLFEDGSISNSGLSKAIGFLLENPKLEAEEIVATKGLMQVNDDSVLEAFVDLVIQNNSGPVEEYKSGKTAVIGFLIGQCMKESKGQGNPQKFKEILEKKLA